MILNLKNDYIYISFKNTFINIKKIEVHFFIYQWSIIFLIENFREI